MKQIERFNVFLAVVTGLVLLWMVGAAGLCPRRHPAEAGPDADLRRHAGGPGAGILHRPPGDEAQLAGRAFAQRRHLRPAALAAGLLSGEGLLRFALVGCVAATVLAFLFTAICDRLASGSAGKVAPLLSAGVLFLAVQGCAGMFL